MFTSMAANRIQPKFAFIVGSAELGIYVINCPVASLLRWKKVCNYILRISQSAPQQLPPLNYLKRRDELTNRQHLIEIEEIRDG